MSDVETAAPEPETPENRQGSGGRGRFQKGKSGNPGGRPKIESEVRELAQKHGRAAIRRLVKIMKSDNDRVAVTACQALLDRGFGKPPQALTGPDGGALPLPAPIINIGWDNGGPGIGDDPIKAAEVYKRIMNEPRPTTSPKESE